MTGRDSADEGRRNFLKLAAAGFGALAVAARPGDATGAPLKIGSVGAGRMAAGPPTAAQGGTPPAAAVGDLGCRWRRSGAGGRRHRSLEIRGL